jgi:large subunit ribosomal protein L31e
MPSESYNVSLTSAYDKPRTKRAKYSITSLYNFLLKHTRKERKDIIISGEVNAYIWSRSITKPPRKIAISIKEDKDNNKVYVFLKDSKEFKDFKVKGSKDKEAKPKKEEKIKETPKDDAKAEEAKPKPEKKTGKLRPMEDLKKQKAETK